MSGPHFQRYVGIDYSGAKGENSRLPGIQIYRAIGTAEPERVPSLDRNWNRREVKEWLLGELRQEDRVIVGIDYAFSFPRERGSPHDWDGFLNSFKPKRKGKQIFRLTERWTSSARSIFTFGVPGQVGPATMKGIPYLRDLRNDLSRGKVHFWPFDGFGVPPAKSVVAEVYPALFWRRYCREAQSNMTTHQRDAYSVARWLMEMDASGFLDRYLNPPLTNEQKEIAKFEGWILGVA